jgi:hypothetical protein
LPKAKCCPNADAITREEHEDARQVARDIAKTKQCDISMKLRKKVEMLFAQLKRIVGLGRLRLRGSCGANDEFLLAATVQNLRKLAKISAAPQRREKHDRKGVLAGFRTAISALANVSFSTLWAECRPSLHLRKPIEFWPKADTHSAFAADILVDTP